MVGDEIMSSMRTGRFVPISNGRNMRPLSLPDCVHLTERCKCGILRVDECLGDRCAFRKTEYECSESRQKWLKALRAMGTEEQERTAAKYYNGKMPWNNA